MSNKLLKNTIVYSIARIIPQLTGFILLPMYTRYMDPSEYGIVQSMQVLSAVLVVFFSLASERSIFRLFYDYETKVEQKKFFGNIVFLIFITSIVFYSLLLINYTYVENIFDSIDFFPYYFLAITNTFFLTFSFVPLNMCQVEGKAIKFSLLSLASFFISLFFIIYFVMYRDEKALGMLKGQAIGSACMLLAYVPFTIKNSTFKLSKEIIKNIFSFCMPMIPALLSAWLLNMSNRVLLDHFITNDADALREIGLYSLSFKIASIGMVILGAFTTAFNPVFYSKAKDNSKNELSKLCFVYTVVSLFICFLISFFSKEIIILFFNEKYYESYIIIPILTLSIFLAQITSLYNLMNYQTKKTTGVMFIILFSAIIAVLFNFILIPKFFSVGASLANVIGVGVNLLLSYLFAKTNFYIKFNLYKILLSSILLIFIIYLNSFIPEEKFMLFLIFKLLIVMFFSFMFFKKYKRNILLAVKK